MRDKLRIEIDKYSIFSIVLILLGAIFIISLIVGEYDSNRRVDSHVISERLLCVSKLCVNDYCFENILEPKEFEIITSVDYYNKNRKSFIVEYKDTGISCGD